MSAREYDLVRRAQAGSSRRYACKDVLTVLDYAGRTSRLETRTADLNETILDVSPRVRWAYSNFKHDLQSQPANDEYGLPASVVSFWDTGSRADALPASGSIVLEGLIEDRHAYIPDVESFGLSKTSPMAFMTAELVIHTRALAYFATRAHGGIDRLRRVGDSTVMPCTDKPDRVRYAAMFDAQMCRGESKLRFDAITTRHDLDVAMLTVYTPWKVTAPGWGPVSCVLVGHLWIDIASGWLVAGETHQTNFMGGVPMPDGSRQTIPVRFESSLELV
jgi:hypothetical protein